jgi:1-aminocyclopropane-1-carboxylate deaminase
MISWDFRAVEQKIVHPFLSENRVRLTILREDLNHPSISGNKLRKLKYNIEAFEKSCAKNIITFGGAHSNHIAATASACKELGIPSKGIIRGNPTFESPTLSLAKHCGMELEFVGREEYRALSKQNGIIGDSFFIPEGANNTFGIRGNSEILHHGVSDFDYCFVCVGTGNTLIGLSNSIQKHQKVCGVNVLKGAEEIQNQIKLNTQSNNWEILNNYHLGGYAKKNELLNEFVLWFKMNFQIQLDPIYTGKMMYAIWDLIKRGNFREKRILAIHTGGLQGIPAYEKRYKVKLT